KVVANRADGGDGIDDHRRGRGHKVAVARVQNQRLALKVNVQAIEAVSGDDRIDRIDEVVARARGGELHRAIRAADGEDHLLAQAVQVSEIGRELGRAIKRREDDGAGGGAGRLTEGDVDDVPFRGNIA